MLWVLDEAGEDGEGAFVVYARGLAAAGARFHQGLAHSQQRGRLTQCGVSVAVAAGTRWVKNIARRASPGCQFDPAHDKKHIGGSSSACA